MGVHNQYIKYPVKCFMNSVPGYLTGHEQGHLQKNKEGNSLQNLLVNYNKENEVVHCVKNDRDNAIHKRQGQIFHEIFLEAILLEHIILSSIYH